METESFIMTFGKIVSSAVVSYVAMKYLLEFLEKQVGVDQKHMVYDKLKKIGLVEVKDLDSYELKIAANLILPEEIKSSWSNVAGLDSVKNELERTVIFPMKHGNKFGETSLMKAPKGILLYGPPGCGKTLIAKATAKEADFSFINLDVSMIVDKSYGESPKLAKAIFTLAEKIKPCIIFIDEIDSLLRRRSSDDHEVTAQLKSMFLSKWDGLATDKSSDIIIMGATNRPDDIDEAIKRRMPKKFHIGLPNNEQRLSVMKLHLSCEEHGLSERQMERLADFTDNFSSNDIEEMCRDAAAIRLEELDLEALKDGSAVESMRKITMMDLLKVATKMKDTKKSIQTCY